MRSTDDAASRTDPMGPSFPIVAVGASSGGLEACRKLFALWPSGADTAFVLVLHLDPHHPSMVVDLLAAETGLAVVQAAEGMAVVPGRVFVIPPGAYLAVRDGVLRLSPPQPRHGVRLPFDFLLASLAADAGPRAACVVLSGAGGDGSAGLRAISAAGGLVIAQDPTEATWSGMPESAIATGLVDHVLTIAEMPAAIAEHAARLPGNGGGNGDMARAFDAVLALVRARAAQDVTLYKSGTIQRRIERRMALAGHAPSAVADYLARLRADPAELDRLVADLLIHVTGFFRDPQVFERLATTAIPELLAALDGDRPLRIWVAGCSTGEEAYSLAILCREAIEAAGSSARLQLLASDVDPEAVATAREGLYPDTIRDVVSAERLARFFIREDAGWRVSPALRDCVVFTVQDLLSDPPFSRIDLISCRNVLIYMGPEAQRRIIGLCCFALRPGGLLLLGTAETPGPPDGRFEVADKVAHLWRRVGHGNPGDLYMTGAARSVPGPATGSPVNRRTVLAETCRRLVLETHAPAAALLNRRFECLYLLGSTDRYLHVAAGHPSVDFLAMSPPALRLRLRAAAKACDATNPVVVVSGGRTADGIAYSVELRAVKAAGEALLLACFLDEPPAATTGPGDSLAPEAARGTAQDAELDQLRGELLAALSDLEAAAEAHAIDAAEALSVNEEYQSTNEELLASKEELQSLNEELTALNGQLQETLERQRTLAADLQNVLYSTDVATLFLDADLRIRVFTPAARALFRVITTDVGRPLSDLAALFHDDALDADARSVLEGGEALGREVKGDSGTWYMRCIKPYRTGNGRVEGVVITFTDITERRRTAEALEEARRVAERADAAKSRFLAAASHDLRQPLQSLTLIHGLLARSGADRARLNALLDRTLASMTNMLDTLLDVNRIEAGDVHPQIGPVAVGPMLARLGEEFAPLAAERGLTLRVRNCPWTILSDPRLLEQMLRNLLSNALKYTIRGGVLVGCRRRGARLCMEVWDTGVGIAAGNRDAVFEPYVQIAHAPRDRTRGLGLGLSIVRRLGEMLDHGVLLRSRDGRGSVFSISAPLAPVGAGVGAPPTPPPPDSDHPLGTILVVEDDPDLCDLLAAMLTAEGHKVLAARTADEARRLAVDPAAPPDALLTDYDLGAGPDGLKLAAELARQRGAALPTVILTGDVTTAALRAIAAYPCVRLAKPATAETLRAAIASLLRSSRIEAAATVPACTSRPTVYVIDDDPVVCDAARSLFEERGYDVRLHGSAEAFLEAPFPQGEACLVVDERLPGMTGVTLLTLLRGRGSTVPAIIITGHGDASTAVAALRAGAADFIEKPAPAAALLASVARAIEHARDIRARATWRAEVAARFRTLTRRERDVLAMVLAGAPNKNIAADLKISQRTVENHRAAVMRKTGADSLPALVRLSLAAEPEA